MAQRTMREIATEIGSRHGVGIKDLISDARVHSIAHVRQEAMAVIYATGRYSLPQIGRFFGGRDHTTVLWGIKRHKSRAATQFQNLTDDAGCEA